MTIRVTLKLVKMKNLTVNNVEVDLSQGEAHGQVDVKPCTSPEVQQYISEIHKAPAPGRRRPQKASGHR